MKAPWYNTRYQARTAAQQEELQNQTVEVTPKVAQEQPVATEPHEVQITSETPVSNHTQADDSNLTRTDHSPEHTVTETLLFDKPRRSPRLAALRQAENVSNITHACLMTSVQCSNILQDQTVNEIHPLDTPDLNGINTNDFITKSTHTLEPHDFVFSCHASKKSKGDPNTMHFTDAKKQADWPEFKKAMLKEVDDFIRRGHWKLVRYDSIDHSKPHDIVSALWSFK